uniref:HTH_Tnp_Tc3_1 domain-containing protein n=1 Tax=Heterorhabditis bacteriophora TaxID=37862 RepID=A0A1I7X371_HETBA
MSKCVIRSHHDLAVRNTNSVLIKLRIKLSMIWSLLKIHAYEYYLIIRDKWFFKLHYFINKHIIYIYIYIVAFLSYTNDCNQNSARINKYEFKYLLNNEPCLHRTYFPYKSKSLTAHYNVNMYRILFLKIYYVQSIINMLSKEYSSNVNQWYSNFLTKRCIPIKREVQPNTPSEGFAVVIKKINLVKKLCVTRMAVHHIVKRYQKLSSVEDHPKGAKPRSVNTFRVIKMVKKRILRDSKRSMRKIASNLNIKSSINEENSQA